MDAGRRKTLAVLAVSAAGIGFPEILRSHGSAPAVWGEMPSDPPGPIWATDPDLRIREIHLDGGLSMWETFYCRPPITLTVVEPTSNAIGNDAFCILWDGKKLHGLNASGRSPAGWSLDRFQPIGRVG